MFGAPVLSSLPLSQLAFHEHGRLWLYTAFVGLSVHIDSFLFIPHLQPQVDWPIVGLTPMTCMSSFGTSASGNWVAWWPSFMYLVSFAPIGPVHFLYHYCISLICTDNALHICSD